MKIGSQDYLYLLLHCGRNTGSLTQDNGNHSVLSHKVRDTLLTHLQVCWPSIKQDVEHFHCYTQRLVIRVDEKLFLFRFAITSRKTMQGWILQRGFSENKLIKSCYSCCRKVIAGKNWYPHAHIFIIRFTSSYLKSRTEFALHVPRFVCSVYHLPTMDMNLLSFISTASLFCNTQSLPSSNYVLSDAMYQHLSREIGHDIATLTSLWKYQAVY